MSRLGIGAGTLAALGVFGLMGAMVAAVPQDQNMNSNINSNMSQGKGHNSNMGGNTMSASLNSTDKKFMLMASQGGMLEVERARVALQRSPSESVKEFAQKMIDDHTAANQELMGIAASKGITLPAGLNPKTHLTPFEMPRLGSTPFTGSISDLQAKMKQQLMLTIMNLDREYVRVAGVKDHEKMEKLFMNEIAKGLDADTKAFAAKTLPVVRMHLSMARDMLKGMKPIDMNSNLSGMSGNMNSNMSGMNSNSDNSNSNMGGKKGKSKNMNSNMGGNMNSNNSNMGGNMNSNNSNR